MGVPPDDPRLHEPEAFTHFDCSYSFQLCTFSPKYQLLRQQTDEKKKGK